MPGASPSRAQAHDVRSALAEGDEVAAIVGEVGIVLAGQRPLVQSLFTGKLSDDELAGVGSHRYQFGVGAEANESDLAVVAGQAVLDRSCPGVKQAGAAVVH